MHIFTESDWAEYTEGGLDDARRAEFEAHLDDCGDCRTLKRRLVRVEESLAAAASNAAISVVSTEQTNLALANVLARILDAEATAQGLGREAITIRLEHLEDILASMCGSWTAVNALRVAAESTIAKSPEDLTAETWTPFLTRLREIAGVFCGDTGARLVWKYGQL